MVRLNHVVRMLPACLCAAALAAAAHAGERWWKFDGKELPSDVVAAATGDAAKRMPKPKVQEDHLVLLESWWKSTAAVAFPCPQAEPAERVKISASITMNTGTEGMGILLLDTRTYGLEPQIPTLENWEVPSLPNAFGIGLDASDPPNRDPFRGSGNLYDRPQHEMSLHWNGRELVKRVTPFDFRDEKPHVLRTEIQFVTGGAEVTVTLDGKPVYDAYFVPGMTAFPGRLVLGARNGETAGDVLVGELVHGTSMPVAAPDPPLHVVAHDKVLNDKEHGTNPVTVNLPEDLSPYGRILLTLALEEPKNGFDPWDRLARLWIDHPTLGKVELLRYITPYKNGHTWTVDVSDFRPLLSGPVKLIQECGTQGEGWLVTTAFDLYKGPAPRYVYRVVPLWCGDPEIGNPQKPVEAFYDKRVVDIPPGTEGAVVRLTVTGHGMSPNTGNAGEFMRIGRALRANSAEYRSMLWKEDNYLNPCRPQGGTWKYDRAGWGPGDIVRPWVVDVSRDAGASMSDPRGGRKLSLQYVLDPYVNEGRGKTWAPFHSTQSVLVLYSRTPAAPPAAAPPAAAPAAVPAAAPPAKSVP